jgi:hypothetical protein
MLLQSHNELAKRYRQKVNDHNYAAALLAGAKFTKEGKAIDVSEFLPYQLEDGRMLSLPIRNIVDRLIKAEKLPTAMIADLYHQKLLPKPQQQ